MKSISLLGIVKVPVLSITIALTLRIRSKAVASLINTFSCAALPIPTIKAVGVASPIAHGQAITNTAIADKMAWGKAAFPPRIHHKKKVTIDTPITTGTKIKATLSIILCTGALLFCAS